jgi:hypothetical protein
LSGITWEISVVDSTTGQTFVTDQTYTGAQASAEWIVEAPSLGGSVVPLGVYSPAVAITGLAPAGDRILMIA